MVEVELGSMDDEALRAALREHVLKRRAFVAGARGIATQTACALVIALGPVTVKLAAEVVFARDEEPGAGVGLQLAPIPEDALAAIESFVRGELSTRPLALDDLPLPPPPNGAPSPSDGPEDLPIDPHATPEHRAMHVRLRALTGVEQRRVALAGNLSERVLLERLYGPNVWEPLLSSGKLTLPEVATIARKGTVPRPLLELVAGNAAWLASGEVQRALLSNPRSSPMVVSKVLRALPKHELLRVPTQTAYPIAVRTAAKELIKGLR